MRSRIGLILIALPVVAILVGLGVWQLQRREWKTGRLTRFEAGLASAPATYEPLHPGNGKARKFKHVRVKGEFLAGAAATGVFGVLIVKT